MDTRIPSLHHITAIARDPRANLAFYRDVLGLRLVKRTVNFDDPGSYHFYYGDATGTPGTILTFFIWPNGSPGRAGAGQAASVALTIPRASLGYWMQRLIEQRIAYSGPHRRFDDPVLVLHDPDGLTIELVGQAAPPNAAAWEQSDVPAEHAIRGIHSAALWVERFDASAELLTHVFGFERLAAQDDRVRYTSTERSAPGHLLDLQAAAGFWKAASGTGTIHHLAWRTPDDAALLDWRERVERAGLDVTPLRERFYFQSIYFQEPSDILFEIATDQPGFTVDEPIDQLGRRLMLPPWLEPERTRIEEELPALHRSEESDMSTPERAFIHRFTAAPDQAHAPTLLLLHGTGGNEDDLLPLGPALLPEANLLSPRGRVLEHGMPRFFRRISERVFDQADLLAQTDALAEFVTTAAAHYQFDPTRLLAVGYSNGANIAGSLLLRHPSVLSGAILFRAMVPFEPEQMPDLAGTSIFISAARHDELIAPAQSEQLAALFETCGAQVTLVWQPGGHALTSNDIDAARGWLAGWGASPTGNV